MEKYKLSSFLPYDDILNYIMSLDEVDVESFIFHNAEDYGVYMITLLEEVARRKNTVFWYIQLGVVCTAFLPYLDGANFSAFYYYLKAHELDPKDVSLLSGILCFGEAPDFILTEEQKKYYANKILELEPNHEKALAIIREVI